MFLDNSIVLSKTITKERLFSMCDILSPNRIYMTLGKILKLCLYFQTLQVNKLTQSLVEMNFKILNFQNLKLKNLKIKCSILKFNISHKVFLTYHTYIR